MSPMQSRRESPSVGSMIAITLAVLAAIACGPRSPANTPATSSPTAAPISSTPPAPPASPSADNLDGLPDWLVREIAELQLVGADHALPLSDSVHVVVGLTRVVVEGKLVMNTRDVAPNGRLQRADPLFQELKAMRERWKQDHPRETFPGVITYWIDGRTTALVVKSVFQTCAFAGYPNGNFGVHRRDQPGRFARLAADARVPGPPGIATPLGRVGVSQVSGRLLPEVIQRIIRREYGLFRSCYEAGLAKDPKLEGKLRVRFAIGRDGSVDGAEAEESELPDTVTKCIVDGFAQLKFPPPEGGIVTVVYPILFSPK